MELIVCCGGSRSGVSDELFCTGTMGELAGVIRLDDRVIGKGEMGPMTRKLSELFAARTAVEGERVA